jgi:hypothetical protein
MVLDHSVVYTDNVKKKPDMKLQKTYKPISNVAVKIEGKVTNTDQTKVTINIGSRSKVTAGMILRVYHIIREVKDPDSGNILDTIEEPVAEIRATEVQENSSMCVIHKTLSTKYAVSVRDKVRDF